MATKLSWRADRINESKHVLTWHHFWRTRAPLAEVYLTNLEASAVTAILSQATLFSGSALRPAKGTVGSSIQRHPSGGASKLHRSWLWSKGGEGAHSQGDSAEKSVLHEFERCLELLVTRLENLSPPRMDSGFDPMIILREKEDEHGKDLGCHVECAEAVLLAILAIVSRKDLYSQVRTPAVLRHLGEIREKIRLLFVELSRWGLTKLCSIALKVDNAMRAFGVSGQDLGSDLSHATRGRGVTEVETSEKDYREALFNTGWSVMLEVFASRSMGVPLSNSYQMLEQSPTELAMLFGSTKTPGNHNYAALGHLMHHLSHKHCERRVKIEALRAVRLILYVMPDSKSMTNEARQAEIIRFNKNESPSHKESAEFKELQKSIASVGAVLTVFQNMQDSRQRGLSDDSEDVLAALRLAVSLLEGGNRFVQDMTCSFLSQPSSQDFFKMVCRLLDMSLDSVKEEKRKEKQRKAEQERRRVQSKSEKKRGTGEVGLGPRGSEVSLGCDGKTHVESKVQEGGGDVIEVGGVTAVHFTFEVFKLIRMMCAGQYTPLQDILRQQPMNRESVDLFQECIKFLTAVEPVVKNAIDRGEQIVPKAMMRCFLMLGDAMHGPNRSNQQSVSNTGIFDLSDRIMAKIRVLEPEQHNGPSDETMDFTFKSSTGMVRGLVRKASQAVMGTQVKISRKLSATSEELEASNLVNLNPRYQRQGCRLLASPKKFFIP